MKIALLLEYSQAHKNELIFNTLNKVASKHGHEVFNTAMYRPELDEAGDPIYTKENPRLTYIHLGIQAALLLNSGAVDFVVTGCGTGQGALMSLNAYPGVTCGYCIDPTDAYLFLQINNGNALSLPYAKGFGWGADLNLETVFEKAFGSPKGQGYPVELRESQHKNSRTLNTVKNELSKPLLEGLSSLDQDLIKTCLTPQFLECFNSEATSEELKAYIEKFFK